MRNTHRRPQYGIARLMDEMFYPNTNTRRVLNAAPKVNVVENEDNYTLKVAAPGYKKDDFNLKVDKDQLIISAKIEKSEGSSSEKITRREYSISSFQRSFHLGETLDSDQITASYEDGILSIAIAKKVKVDDTKLIEIQ